MEQSDFPKHLIEQIKNKNVILFLGSGASIGAMSDDGKGIPSTQELADSIADKFLGGEYKGQSLSRVAELAIHQSSLLEFQTFIRDIFDKFHPADFHKKIPLFPWNQIVTTNYDLLMEEAYQGKESIQDLVPLYKNTPQYQISKSERTLLYLKLHGCIRNINDPSCPLIFTPDQYIDHKLNRDRLFERFFSMANDYPILFVGHSLSDIDIRTYLHTLESLKGSKPMSFLVAPHLQPLDMKFWQSKGIDCLKMSFKDFLEGLEKQIDKSTRVLANQKIQAELPIYEKFVVNPSTVKPTEALQSLLNNDVDYVTRNIPAPSTDPKSFYRGYFENWDPIVRNLDVKRTLSENILYEVLLDEVQHTSSTPYFYLIKGNAGSGKSVLLKRLAFEAGTEINRICLHYKPYVDPKFETLQELHNFTKERIYLFVDNVASHKYELCRLLEKARKRSLPITIIGCERMNLWNTECNELKPFLTDSYHLKYLNDKEISELLALLEKFHCLGALAFKTEQERTKLLQEQAGRELLVALYESTNSKPFEEIIFDEYNKINDPVAKSLYLTVSILDRLGAVTRAGLISRVHGIGFKEFQEKFFKPLEYIVFARMHQKLNDIVYQTRHKQVAEFVFSTVLRTPQERFDEYARIIRHLNVDFESDRTAFFAMTNAKNLMQLFPDPIMVGNFFDIASESNPEDKKILQQRGIYEMISPGGNLSHAEKYLNLSREDGKFDPVLEHSFIELTLRKADKAKYESEFNHYIDEVIVSANTLKDKTDDNLYAYHSILKAMNMKLEYIIDKNDEVLLERAIREAEKYFLEASQNFPGNQYIVEAESRFNEILNKQANALKILKKSFETLKASPFMCLRYSNLLELNGQVDEAIKAVKESLEINSNEKDLNFKLAELLSKYDKAEVPEILHYLRRSFTKGDSRFKSQFWYARAAFINNQIPDAKNIWSDMATAKMDPAVKYKPTGRIMKNGAPVKFEGQIVRLYYNYGFIKAYNYVDWLFYSRKDINMEFEEGEEIIFEIAFNYRGPVAVHINSKVNLFSEEPKQIADKTK